ncbi:MAG: hypothetical protein R3A44_12855 [Caldilineaceae bacterium]
MHTAQAPIPPAATATHGGLTAGKVGNWRRRASQFPLGPHTAPDPFELAAALAGVLHTAQAPIPPAANCNARRTGGWKGQNWDAVHRSFR